MKKYYDFRISILQFKLFFIFLVWVQKLKKKKLNLLPLTEQWWLKSCVHSTVYTVHCAVYTLYSVVHSKEKKEKTEVFFEANIFTKYSNEWRVRSQK